MFSKNKKEKNNPNSNLIQCEAPNCPSPEIKYPKENCFNFNGLIFCQFCYTKQLSEQQIEVMVEESKTKKVDSIEMNRISAHQLSWDTKNKSIAHLSRIGQSSIHEKYTEELAIWKDLVKQLEIDPKHQQIKKVSRLSQVQHTRVIETSGGSLIASFISNQEYTAKLSIDNILKNFFKVSSPITNKYQFKTLPKYIQDWIVQNKILEINYEDQNNILLYLVIIEDTLVSLEQFTENMQVLDVDDFFFGLGQYFYLLNFIGSSFPYQIFVISKYKELIFLNTTFTFTEASFADSKASLQYLYLTVPQLLDENFFQLFNDGVTTEQNKLQSLLNQSDLLKTEILKFFNSNHIQYNENKLVISLDLIQEK